MTAMDESEGQRVSIKRAEGVNVDWRARIRVRQSFWKSE